MEQKHYISPIGKVSHILNWITKKMSPIISSDKLYLNLRYLFTFGKTVNWENPQTYNEKLQWLKIYDRTPLYTIMVDKYLVKKYVSEIIGDKYIIPTIGVWDNVDDIDFKTLPDKFVLKCNHNSGGGMFICKDKSKIDYSKVRAGLKKGLQDNYYIWNREWPYKNVPRKIIAEKYMEDKITGELRDYKFFCFDGDIKGLFIATDRSKGEHSVCFDFFDEDFNHLSLLHGHPNAKQIPNKPSKFEEMKEIARTLSKGIPHIRVDLYEINGEVYFGELTFSHWGGFMPFIPPDWDLKFGEWIHLKKIEKN